MNEQKEYIVNYYDKNVNDKNVNDIRHIFVYIKILINADKYYESLSKVEIINLNDNDKINTIYYVIRAFEYDKINEHPTKFMYKI